jgi:hypothetical protein
MLFQALKARVRGRLQRATMVAFGSVGVAAICFFIGRNLEFVRIARAQTVVAPYQLQMEIYTFQDNPAGQLLVKETKARRTDGATVLTEDILLPIGERTSRKITYADGTILSLNDSIAAKTTCHLASSSAVAAYKEQLINPPRACIGAAGETLKGYAKVLGQDVAVIESASSSNEILTRWVAPALGCLTLQYRVELKLDDGSRTLQAEGRPVSLQIQEPDPDLFESGPTYTELAPSARIHKLLTSEGLPWSATYQTEGQQLDANHSTACESSTQ